VKLASDEADDPLTFERMRVVIYLEGELRSEPITATMEQKNRKFIPDTVVIPAGSTVSFPNLDPIFHNVFSLSKPKTFDLGNYPKDHTRTVTFAKPGIVFVDCHLHPNMAGVIVVTPNKWSAKADATGRFQLRGVPPGSYRVVAWHRAAGFFRQTVKVTENRSSEVQFLIPLAENGAIAIAQR
jgi:plastocyanin